MAIEPTAAQAMGHDIGDLGPGGDYALWAFRACACGHTRCPTLLHGLTRALGDNAEAALSTIYALTRELGVRGRRPVMVAPPGAALATADELSVTAALAAEQRRDAALRDAHLTWLFAGPPTQAAQFAVARIAMLFTAHGLQVQQPRLPRLQGAAHPAIGPRPARLEAVTIH